MKFIVNDQVLVTAGKDKGKKGVITKVFPSKNTVVVKGVNLYTKHIKKQAGRSGEKVRLERPLPTANIAIINDKGLPDRVKFKITKGIKGRVFAKTGKSIPVQKQKKTSKK